MCTWERREGDLSSISRRNRKQIGDLCSKEQKGERINLLTAASRSIGKAFRIDLSGRVIIGNILYSSLSILDKLLKDAGIGNISHPSIESLSRLRVQDSDS
jgi:hypothetical protein